MASITDLRQKRAALWEKTKKFLDNAKRENDMLSAEDVETSFFRLHTLLIINTL